jgi:hypothetical protein
MIHTEKTPGVADLSDDRLWDLRKTQYEPGLHLLSSINTKMGFDIC